MAEDLIELVEIGDLDELLRATDRLCDAREWSALLELRDRCRAAVERGKQLWPAANHVEYRLALEAPSSYAARMLTDVAGDFGLGPLAEVAAAAMRGVTSLGMRRRHRRPRCVCTNACCAARI